MSFSKKILVIDDSPTMVMITQTKLEEKGYSVITAYDGETGLKKAKDEKPDLVLLDIMLPGIDGYKVCETLKTDVITENIPVVMLTSKDMGEDFDRALEHKADWYIVKPFNDDHLFKVIEKLLD